MDNKNYYLVNLLLISLKYSELKKLRDDGLLIPGYHYRITDYVTKTVQLSTKSAGNVFDVIVLAISANELSHIARAIQHEGDTYFDGNDLGAWELWYDLDNDTDKYAWADAINGKGVIYRMIDDKANDCPYDFKNILFYNTEYTDNPTKDKYYYTFSYVVFGNLLYDGSVEKRVNLCSFNSMGVRMSSNKMGLSLLFNVFRNQTFGTGCHHNTFGTDCHHNTFRDGCTYNTFGIECNYNTFGTDCHHNTFRDGCTYNTFGTGCHHNTFGIGCHHNTFGIECNYNTFGIGCHHNTFGHFRSGYKVDSAITMSEEFYDDGSGQLVPIKHPDLSTQPSILPYKFMGQYVYEQLVFLGEYDVENTKISTEIPCQAILVSNPLFLKCDGFGYGKYIKGGSQAGTVIRKGITGMPIDLKLTFIQAQDGDNIFRVEGSVSEAMANTGVEIVLGINPIKVYAHIVYTSTPEEGGYYGYNSY